MLCFYSLWMCVCIVKTISLLTFNKTVTSIQTAHFPQIDVMAFNGWPHFGHLMHMSFAFILSRDSGSRVQARQRQVKQYWLRRACCLSDVVMWPTCGPRINVKYCHTRNFHAHEMIANLMNCSDSWKYTVVELIQGQMLSFKICKHFFVQKFLQKYANNVWDMLYILIVAYHSNVVSHHHAWSFSLLEYRRYPS